MAEKIDSPSLIVLVALLLLSILTCVIIVFDYLRGNSENVPTLFPIVVGAILSLVGFAYGVNAKTQLEEFKNSAANNKGGGGAIG